MLLLISKTNNRLGRNLLHLATSINVPSRLGSFSKLLDSPESNQEQQTKKCLDKEPPPEKSTCHPFYQRLERNISQEESLEYNFRRPKRKAKEYGNHAPKSIYFQVIGNGGVGVGQSLVLYTDQRRYLFNCGENTQRLIDEHCRFNILANLENIFITSRTWKNLGGLLGMCLSLRTSGAPGLSLHGPRCSMDLFEATKSFIALEEFDVDDHTNDDHVYEDNAILIEHVQLDSEKKFFAPKPIYSTWVPDTYVAKPSPTLGNPRRQALKWAKERIDQSVKAYVVRVKPAVRPVFRVNKCVALGVPPGLLFNELKAGREVVLDDGTLIRPSDVQEVSDDSAEVFIVIECPNKDYLSSLLSEKQLNFTPEDAKFVRGIFHFTPRDVIESDEYSGWVNSFPDETRHIVINDNSLGYGSRDAIVHNGKLREICPQIFPDLLKVQQNDLDVKDDAYAKIRGRVRQAQTGLKMHARPFGDEIAGRVEDLRPEQIQFEIHSCEGVKDAIKCVRKNIRLLEEESKALNVPHYPIVTFLGTGSTFPSKYRNLSAILIETQPDNFILLDCGEGTLLQLYRQFGRQQTRHILRNLKALYVSHLHADHHMGLIGVVLERSKSFEEVGKSVDKMFVIAPSLISQYLTFYHYKFEPILTDLYQIESQHLLYFHPNHRKFLKLDSYMLDVFRELLHGTGLKSIRTSVANHCPDSFCVALVTKEDYKIVYTGDTRPNKGLHDLGTSNGHFPDLLIHEATMEHHMLRSCIAKKHSTFTEAALEGLAMKAKHTILTHFSQRYSKIPVLDEIELDGMDSVGIAFDSMTFNPATLGHVRLMLPALRPMFPKEVREMDIKRRNFDSNNFHERILCSLRND